jgi:hypothetical protein
MLLNLETGLMIQQAIRNVRGVAYCATNRPNVEGRVLV